MAVTHTPPTGMRDVTLKTWGGGWGENTLSCLLCLTISLHIVTDKMSGYAIGPSYFPLPVCSLSMLITFTLQMFACQISKRQEIDSLVSGLSDYVLSY